MKTLLYMRHGIKGAGEFSQIITEENLQNNPTLNSDSTSYPLSLFKIHLHCARHFFHGFLIRTAQTLLSTVTKFGLKGQVHQPIKEIGDNELFVEWKAKGVNFGANGRTNFLSMKEDLSVEEFNNAVDYCRVGLEKMFDLMSDEPKQLPNVGLAYGHSPVIELCTYSVDKTFTNLSVKEYNGVIFQQSDDGIISIVEYINF